MIPSHVYDLLYRVQQLYQNKVMCLQFPILLILIIENRGITNQNEFKLQTSNYSRLLAVAVVASVSAAGVPADPFLISLSNRAKSESSRRICLSTNS